MSDELKPCPFCGHIPKVFPENPKLEGNAWGTVECVNISCPARPCVKDGEDCCDDRGSDKYKEAAIQRWNTRTP